MVRFMRTIRSYQIMANNKNKKPSIPTSAISQEMRLVSNDGSGNSIEDNRKKSIVMSIWFASIWVQIIVTFISGLFGWLLFTYTKYLVQDPMLVENFLILAWDTLTTVSVLALVQILISVTKNKSDENKDK